MTFYEEGVGNSSAAAYDQRLVPWYFQHWGDRMVELASLEAASDAVDLACGSGMITRALLANLGPDGRVAGVDLNPEMLAYAQSTVSDDRVTWHEADAADLPFDNASVDVVCCHQGFQFFPDRKATLDEIRRILRPGGRVVAAVWGQLDDNPGVPAFATAIGEFLGPDIGQAMTGPCGFPDLEALRALFDDGGFVDIQAEAVQATAHHQDVREAMNGQLAALPIAGSIDALGAYRRDSLLDRVCEALEPYVDETGALSIPSTSNIAVAAKV